MINLIAVITDSFDENTESLSRHVKRIISTLQSIKLPFVIIIASHGKLDPKGTSAANEVSNLISDSVQVSVTTEGTLGMAYLQAIQHAIRLGATHIIEIDSSGGHLPEEITRFIEAFKNADVVFSTRFAWGGINKYPLQRKVVSLFGTVLAKLALHVNLSDGTSGFEGYTTQLINEVFRISPPDTWLSATIGPFHFYQTELRALICNIARYNSEIKVVEVPITYGQEKSGKNLKAKYILQAFRTYLKFTWKIAQLQKVLINPVE
jgi:hypothetical protein